MALTLRGFVDVRPATSGAFDHGDVHLPSGRIFVAHTAAGAVAVLDGPQMVQLSSIAGCSEASGVLCAPEPGLVFAAARGAGKVLVIDAGSGTVVREFMVGPRPNGLAWDSRRQRLLVADVEDLTGRLIDPATGTLLQQVLLPGRPRWAMYHAQRDRFSDQHSRASRRPRSGREGRRADRDLARRGGRPSRPGHRLVGR
jgi:hypothetical protein